MQFFAVTKTSLYRVSDEIGDFGFPIVEKIALRQGASSKVAVGARLNNGHLVGITPEWILLYDSMNADGKRLTSDEVNTNWHGGHTSLLVALFLDEKKARKCLKAKNLGFHDPRWKEQTKEVLDAIGDNHPIFIVSKRHEFYVD